MFDSKWRRTKLNGSANQRGAPSEARSDAAGNASNSAKEKGTLPRMFDVDPRFLLSQRDLTVQAGEKKKKKNLEQIRRRDLLLLATATVTRL